MEGILYGGWYCAEQVVIAYFHESTPLSKHLQKMFEIITHTMFLLLKLYLDPQTERREKWTELALLILSRLTNPFSAGLEDTISARHSAAPLLTFNFRGVYPGCLTCLSSYHV